MPATKNAYGNVRDGNFIRVRAQALNVNVRFSFSATGAPRYNLLMLGLELFQRWLMADCRLLPVGSATKPGKFTLRRAQSLKEAMSLDHLQWPESAVSVGLMLMSTSVNQVFALAIGDRGLTGAKYERLGLTVWDDGEPGWKDHFQHRFEDTEPTDVVLI